MMESYSVSVNGQVFGKTIDCAHDKVPLAYRRMCSWAYIQDTRDRYYSSPPIEWTPLNGNCKKKGIPGIISSAMVGGVLLVASVWWYCRQRSRRQAASNTTSNNPLATIPSTSTAGLYHAADRFNPPLVGATHEPVAIPLERKHPSTNPGQQQILEPHQNPHTVVGIESAIEDDPTSTPPPTLTGAAEASNDAEDFA